MREETSVGGKVSVDLRGREGYQGLPSGNQGRIWLGEEYGGEAGDGGG